MNPTQDDAAILAARTRHLPGFKAVPPYPREPGDHKLQAPLNLERFRRLLQLVVIAP